MALKHDPLMLSAEIKRVMNRDAVFLSHTIIGTIVLVDTHFSQTLSSVSKVAIYCTVGLVAMLGIMRYFNLLRINDNPALHLLLYHLVIGTAIILFAKVGSIYPFIWLIMLFLTNYFYGRRAALYSLLALVAVIELQLYRVFLVEGVPHKNEIIGAFAQIGVIGAISLFFVDAQAVSDKDRKLVMTTMAKAQLERQRLNSLINNMTDGVIATGEDGRITLYNAAALNILDTNVDVQGSPITELMHVIDKDKQPIDIIALAKDKNTFLVTRDYRLVYSEDDVINLALNISPIKLGYRQDAETGFIFTFRDITREKSLEEERDEFISVVSHELRTPVAITEANISNVQFLMDQPHMDQSLLKTSVDAAHKQVVYLASMLNDLSTLSRAERGKLELNPEPINPRDVMQSLFSDYKGEAAAKGLTLQLQIADSTPSEIISNKLYMREILQNFITNAIKYTPSGSVTLQSEKKAGGVLFKVSDTGIGISKSDQKKVFDKFYRSEDYRTRESSGTGLGLYVTMKLCKLLQAQISLKSELNKGSTFSIFIPDLRGLLPKHDAANPAVTQSPAAPPAATTPTVAQHSPAIAPASAQQPATQQSPSFQRSSAEPQVSSTVKQTTPKPAFKKARKPRKAAPPRP